MDSKGLAEEQKEHGSEGTGSHAEPVVANSAGEELEEEQKEVIAGKRQPGEAVGEIEKEQMQLAERILSAQYSGFQMAALPCSPPALQAATELPLSLAFLLNHEPRFAPRSKYFPAVSFSYQCFRDCFLQTPSNHPKNSRGDEFYSPAESIDHLLFPSYASDYRYVSSWFDRSQPKLMCRRHFGPCPKRLSQVQGNQENHNS